MPARDALVEALPSDVRQQRGLRFSDEPTGAPAVSQEASRRYWASSPKPRFRILAILATLWHNADPLSLELWVDTLGQGANLLFNGPRSKGFKMDLNASARKKLWH